jgi:hypothetical protein
MRSFLVRSGVALLLAVSCALAADDDKASPKDKKDAADKMINSGQVAGKLVKWGSAGSAKTITVEVVLQVPNPGGIQTMANLKFQLADAARDTNAVNRARRVADIQAQMALHEKDLVKNEHHDIEFQPGDDMIVRWRNPPTMLDDKGKPRKLTDKEKKDLKGPDPKLPGYTAAQDDLKNDEIVTVYLAKKKKDKDDKTENKPVVTMIVIELEPK